MSGAPPADDGTVRITRLAAVLAALVATVGCSSGPSDGERTLVAAGARVGEVQVATSSTTVTVAPPTTVAVATTVKSHPSTGRPAARSAPRSKGYSPAPPQAGVTPDGYGGYGGTATVSGAGGAVTLRVYPREQYVGERFQVGVVVAGSTAVRSIRIDLGDGTVEQSTPLRSWECPTAARETHGSAGPHMYANPGTYRITATVTVVPCAISEGPPGGWTLPDGRPAVDMPVPWRPTGPDQALSVSMDVLQRGDSPPRPVGPPPGP